MQEIIRALRSLTTLDYWTNRFVQRTSWFSKALVEKYSFNTTVDSSHMERLLTEEFLMYLHDHNVFFSYNEQKQGFRPDVSTYHFAIEVKVIFPNFEINKIKDTIHTARTENDQQIAAHPAQTGFIIVFNASQKYNLESEDTFHLKNIDLYIGLTGITPSKGKRTILKISPNSPYVRGYE